MIGQRLAGRRALVTGSTTGIGEAIARRFAAEGASVMIHGRSEERAAAIVGELRDSGARASLCIGDLEDTGMCARLVEAAAAGLGGLDILVNNAALMTRGDLEATDEALFARTMAVNAGAPLALIRAALPHLRDSGHGAVLNIGSVNSYCGERSQLAYAMSKGALTTLSRNLADALGREKIRVNHLNVGWVLSRNEYDLKRREGLAQNWPETVPTSIAPSGRLLRPDEIASFAVSFVEDAGGFVTGAVVDLEQYPMIGRNPPKQV